MDTSRIEGYDLENLKISTSIDQLFLAGHGLTRLSLKEIQNLLPSTKVYLLRGNPINKRSFDVLCNVLLNFDKLDNSVKLTAWSSIKKACNTCSSLLGRNLTVDDNQSSQLQRNTQEDQAKNRHNVEVLKMSTYLIIHMSLKFHSVQRSQATLDLGKKGKKQKQPSSQGIAIEEELRCTLSFQLSIIDLDIRKIFPDQIVEDDFISQISDFCYSLLEDKEVVKNKQLKSMMIQLLGVSIKKYSQSVSASLKMTQLLQNFEHLDLVLAQALHEWTEKLNCKVVASELLRELSNIPERELMRDSSSSKTISSFTTEVAKLLPDCMQANIHRITPRLEEESYQMRNCVIECAREVLIHCLSKDGMEKKARDEREHLLEILFDHGTCDVNAFVRTRAINSLSTIVKAGALPVHNCSTALAMAKKLLLDKSNSVRKATIQLMAEVIKKNPFTKNLTTKGLDEQIKEYEIKLKEIETKLKADKKQEICDQDSNKDAETDQNEAIEEKNIDSEKSDKNSESGGIDADKAAENNCEVDLLSNEEYSRLSELLNYIIMTQHFVCSFNETHAIMQQLVRSKTATDVLEAIEFYKTAYTFNLAFANEGIHVLMDMIWSDDPKIKDAVVEAYKELFFSKPGSQMMFPGEVVTNMMKLISQLDLSSWDSFENLLGELKKANVIPNSVVQILWNNLEKEKEVSYKQTKTTIQLIGMLATEEPSILHGKINVLVKVGLKSPEIKEDAQVDFECARLTCIAFSKLVPSNKKAGIVKKQCRYDNNNIILQSIYNLLLKGFNSKSETYVNFAMEAIGVLFQLAKFPMKMSKNIFYQIKDILVKEGNNEILARFFSICGQLALKTLVFIETDVLSEINRQNANETHKKENKKLKKKNSKSRKSKDSRKSMDTSMENDEDSGSGLEDGIGIDDQRTEQIKNILDNHIVGENTMLGSISKMLIKCCERNVDPKDISSVRAQQAASLTLAKFMIVSRNFCVDHLDRLIKLLEKSPLEGVRVNLLVAVSDLCVRFPNELEQYNSHIYNRLNDESYLVRICALKVLTNLVLSDMIKVKGHVSEIARCIVDDNCKLQEIARRFFNDLSKKGNSLYNVIPDIISRLSETKSEDFTEDYRQIMKFLFEFINKDKQAESLIEKLCHRFKATRERNQWRNLAYCLTLLPYSEKGFKKIYENFSFYTESLGDVEIYEYFKFILAKVKKNTKSDMVKAQVEEFEGKVNEKHLQEKSDFECANNAAQATQQHRMKNNNSILSYVTPAKKKKTGKKEDIVSDSDDEEPAPERKALKRSAKNKKVVEFSSSEDEEDDMLEEVDGSVSPSDVDKTPIRTKPTPKTRRTTNLLRDL